jgi:hypothetical protein
MNRRLGGGDTRDAERRAAGRLSVEKAQPGRASII